jgi:LysM repeat protein
MPSDTLEKVAKEVGITVEELKNLNGIKMDMYLKPGSFLIVPKYNSEYEKYIVQKGDNMYAIARKYGVDYNSLLTLNGLDDSDYIYPNETILIPRGFNIYITNEETIGDIENKINMDSKNWIDNNKDLIIEENQIIKY